MLDQILLSCHLQIFTAASVVPLCSASTNGIMSSLSVEPMSDASLHILILKDLFSVFSLALVDLCHLLPSTLALVKIEVELYP